MIERGAICEESLYRSCFQCHAHLSVVQTKECGGPDLLHECLKSVSWPAAEIGHSDVTLSQCFRETK